MTIHPLIWAMAVVGYVAMAVVGYVAINVLARSHLDRTYLGCSHGNRVHRRHRQPITEQLSARRQIKIPQELK